MGGWSRALRLVKGGVAKGVLWLDVVVVVLWVSVVER